MKVQRYKDNRIKRKVRLQYRVPYNNEKLSVKVFRSNMFTYALVVDTNAKVLKSFSTKGIEGKKTEAANKLGENVGNYLKENKLQNVFFDRSGYRYHGRIKAVAEGIRQSGINL